MNKELTPLEALNWLVYGLTNNNYAKEELPLTMSRAREIITNALKRLEKIDKSSLTDDEVIFLHNNVKNLYREEDKKLKAFEIIKKKRVAINILYMSSSAYVYNVLYEVVIIPSGKTPKWEYKLTQEEFDLLKEVLLWVK